MDQRLKDKVAIVVGGGQMPGEGMGNGRITSLTLARHGAKVMVAARHLDRAQATVDMILAEGGEATAFAMDVRHKEECDALMAACAEKYGKIDILVYNVGIQPDFDPKTRAITEEAWDNSMHINLRGTVYCYESVIPYMAKQGGGSCLCISSIAGLITNIGYHTGMMVYAFAKRAEMALTENFAMAYAQQGIRFNTVVLGPVRSIMGLAGGAKMMGEDVSLDEADAFKDKYVPLKGGQASVQATADACLFLASDESKFITGVNLPVDGGVTCRRG